MMKVADLIDLLQSEDPEMEVAFGYNYGDYARTTVAAKIHMAEVNTVVHSDYHNMDRIIDDDDRNADKARRVLLLT